MVNRKTLLALTSVLVLAGCAPGVALEGRPCPCLVGEGYVCCPALGRCVRESACAPVFDAATPDGPGALLPANPDAPPAALADTCQDRAEATFGMAGRFLDFKPMRLGLVFVLRDQLLLVTRNGSVRKQVKVERPLTAVAFSDTTTVVSDAERLTVYNEELLQLASIPTGESYRSLALIGQTALCSPSVGGTAWLSTYNLEKGGGWRQSLDGLGTLWAMPDRPFFVSVDRSSSKPALTLFRFGEAVDSYGRAPADQAGDFATALSFAGSPTSKIVTSDGFLLTVFGAGCDPAVVPTAGSTACLHQTGHLEPFEPGLRLVAAVPGPLASIWALVALPDMGMIQAAYDAGTGGSLGAHAEMLGTPDVLRLRFDPLCRMGVVSKTAGTSLRTGFVGYYSLAYGAAIPL
jgi:hypothetical protein